MADRDFELIMKGSEFNLLTQQAYLPSVIPPFSPKIRGAGPPAPLPLDPPLPYELWQEIIKVREWIPHIGHLTKVIRLKLFLDIAPSFSRMLLARCVDSRSDFLELPEKNGGNVILCFGFVSYRRCILHSQPPFCAVGHFVCFSARLAVHYFAVYSVLGS